MPRRRGGKHRNNHRPEDGGGGGGERGPASSDNAMSSCKLPNDVVADILSRLPVKSLLRFSCVCKPFLHLLSNPRFLSLHLHRSQPTITTSDTLLLHTLRHRNNPTTVSLLNTNNSSTTPNLPHPFPLCFDTEIVGSINGLVCATTLTLITLWNPATKHYRYIKTPKLNKPTSLISVSVGFAFDSVKNDYKIIRVICYKPKSRIPKRVEIYSLNDCVWKEIKRVDLDFTFLDECVCSVVVRGVPYWLVCIGEVVDFTQCFLFFDVVSEEFRHFKLPFIRAHDDTTRLRPVNFKDSLALLVYSEAPQPPFSLSMLESYYHGPYPCYCRPGEESKCVDVWMREESDDGGGRGSWIKKFTFGPIFGVDRLVGCSRNGLILLENTEGVLVMYDPDTEEVKHVAIDGGRKKSFLVYCYSESLVPIKESVKVGTLDKKFVDQLEKQDKKYRYH